MALEHLKTSEKHIDKKKPSEKTSHSAERAPLRLERGLMTQSSFANEKYLVQCTQRKIRHDAGKWSCGAAKDVLIDLS